MLRAQDGTVGNRGPDRLGHGDAVARCPVRKLSGSEVPLLSVAEKAGACRPFGAEDRKGISCLSGPGMTEESMSTADPNGIKHRSEEHTSELQSQSNLVCRLLLEKKKTN